MQDVVGAWLGLSSLVVSVAVLVFGLLQYKQVARKDFVEDLRRRIEICEANHQECEQERARLTKLNMELLMETRTLSDRLIQSQRSPPGEIDT